jgi:thioredoxin-related protein
MKRINLLLCLLFFCLVSAVYSQQQVLSADTLLKRAYQAAVDENKNIMVVFRASWCGWCRKMDTSLTDKVCKQFFDDNYIILHLTVHESRTKNNLENKGAAELMAKYNGYDSGIPFWLIFDKTGKLLADSQIRKEGEGLDKKGQNSGCPATADEVRYFISVLKNTSHLTGPELQVIEKRFRQNEN